MRPWVWLSSTMSQLIGNLGRDPEVRQHGRPASRSPRSTSPPARAGRTRNPASGVERTEWHRVVVFSEGLATIAEKHLEKGMKVRIEGKLRTRKWEDQAGQDRYSTEVHVENYAGAINFDLKRAGDGGPVSGPPTASPGLPEPEDDIPF